MRNGILQVLLAASLVYTITGCAAGPAPTGTVATPIPTSVPPSPTRARPTPTPTPQGRTIVVNSTADSGPGTLRQALSDAENGDTITFDSSVFPPNAPETIAVTTGLPQISQGHLTIDASDAGVILDGSQLPRDTWIPGLDIVSDGNTIRGMQVIQFTGVGIVVAGHGRNNTIGGDRNTGTGPIGQGNLSSGNNFGIGLWDYATGNIVTGNLIGTDASGTGDLGNSGSGVWITESGFDNKVGPDNIIAYNGKHGIEIESSESVGNILTRNSIHDNDWAGIRLWRGGNADLGAPFVSAFDLAGGSVSGTACANCTVEIFSDRGDEGATYEGQAVADGSGLFAFSTGAYLTNPNITLTTIDPDGNTSGFSQPIGATTTILTLQEGNSLPGFALVDRPSAELADNRFGISYNGLWLDVRNNSLGSILNDITDLGLKRIDTALYEVEPPIDWSVSEYDIPPEFDQFINDLADNRVAVNFMLHYWDKAGHASGTELSTPRFQTDDQVQDYVDYVRFIVSHFKGRIQYYTIWSESDNCGWGGIKCIRPDDYINLARQTIPVIREEDPQAKVVLAPVGNLFFAHDYLFTLLNSDDISLFDVVSWHGMYDVAPDNAFFGNYYYEYPSIVEEIKQTASADGFQGEYWATELTWCSEWYPGCHPADQPWPQQPTDLLAAKYYARAVAMHRGLDLGLAVGGIQATAPWSVPILRNLNTVMDGASPIPLTVEIESAAPIVKSYGFVLPNGDRLLAVWTDGPAVEDDPGVKTNLTFPGLSAGSVTGIDVLNGFEQEMITDVEGGALVIHDLLVKDYPIILRFTS